MNTYLIPVIEKDNLYIKKIVATSENAAKDKLYNYFFNLYESIEGDTLEEVKSQLLDLGVDFGQIYDSEELI